MKTAITLIVVVAIFVPYRLSEFGQDASFWQDFLVAFVAFGIASGLTYVIRSSKDNDSK